MNSLGKRNFLENEKTSYNSYNVNSFRVVSNHVPEKKLSEKEKLMSPRLILQSVEKIEKDPETNKKQQIKPRLLTGKLPSAFGMRYKSRAGSDASNCETSPKKLIVNDNMNHIYSMCVTEGDDPVPSRMKDINERKQNLSAKNTKRNVSGIFSSDSDSNDKKPSSHKSDKILLENFSGAEKQFTKPIIIKQNICSSANRHNTNQKEKTIPHNNFLINNANNSNVHSDSKSTGNNSQGSSQCPTNLVQSNGNANRVSISRTHDAFFPKIKNNFDMCEIEHNPYCHEIKKKFNSNNGIVSLNNSSISNKNVDDAVKDENIRLEDGISLSIIKSGNNKRIKKFFHVPNFEIYSIKEIPMSSKFFISNFREKLTHWKSNIGSSYRFIKIYNEYVNNPEGFISLVMDYLPGFSLQDIVENVGSINESVLCKLAIQIVQCLQEYKGKFNEDFVDFCTCDVLFDKSGNLKLMQKFIDHECINNDNKLDNSNTRCKCFDHFHKSFKQKINTNKFFDLGYTLLISALGGMTFESLDYFGFNYQSLLKTPYLKKCCLLHLLISLESSNLLAFNNKIKISNFINNKLFSENFIDFLCKALSFERHPDINIIILNHPWIQISNYVLLNNKQNKVRVSMKELIKLSREFKKAQVKNLVNTNEKKFNNFLNNFDIILSNNKQIKKDDLIERINIRKDVIKDLASEFDLNPDDLVSKLKTKVLMEVKSC